jgi:hypothetical protein
MKISDRLTIIETKMKYIEKLLYIVIAISASKYGIDGVQMMI